MRKLFLPFIAVTLFLLHSCASNENMMDEETAKTVAQSYDVYIAGRENNKACYWKNNVKTELPGGENLVPLEIKVKNNDIFVTGSTGVNPTSFKSIHYFWKNGTKTEVRPYLNLPISAQYDITAFTVNNGDIYFAGYTENPTTSNPTEKYQLCYWKNGVKTLLYKSQYIPSAEGIAVANSTTGTEVYVSARITDNNQNTDRGYFRNTTFNSLNQPSYVYNFAQNNNGLHILFQKNSKYYSKNISANTETLIGDYILTLPFYGKIISDAHVNDLYTIYYNQGETYFKSSNIISTSFSSLPYIQDLFVLSNNIYMIKYTTANNIYTGKVYINGVETQSITSVQNGTINYTGTFNAIDVVEN